MTDRHLMEGRLSSIRDHVARIREKLPGTRDEFVADREAQEVVAFNLFLAFQDALDVAAHVIADRDWPVPSTNRAHFEILANRRALTAPTATAMARCAGLRNLIAHSYGGLDLGRLYEELPAGVTAIESFCAEIGALA